ncbi:MAG TPA: hypothetical protein PLJ44_11040, partial [Victivallales bacterium]|nr:hypothetical protein [Victivallales bacterium]
RYKKVIDIFRKNPDYLNNFQPMPFNSGYFMCVKPIGVDAEPLREELLSKYNTGVIVLSGFMRIAFSSVPLNQLDELFSNINQAIKNLKKG